MKPEQRKGELQTSDGKFATAKLENDEWRCIGCKSLYGSVLGSWSLNQQTIGIRAKDVI